MLLNTNHEKMGAVGRFETVPYQFCVVFFWHSGFTGNRYHYHSTRERSVNSKFVYLEYRFGQVWWLTPVISGG